MVADFLCRGVTGSLRPDGDRFVRGDVISVVPTGHIRGTKEIMPAIIWIECPSVDPLVHAHMAGGVVIDLQLEILAEDDAANTYDLRLYSATDSSIARRAIPVTLFLGHYDVPAPLIVDRAAHFTFRADDIIQSVAFWGMRDLIHTLGDYDPVTGVRRLMTDYSVVKDRIVTTARVAERAQRQGISQGRARGLMRQQVDDGIAKRISFASSVESHTRATSICVCDWERSSVRDEFLVDAKDDGRMEFQIAKFRHRFAESIIVAAEAAGGSLEVPDLSGLLDRTTV